MKNLVLPVPQTVSATYTVPVSSPVSTAEARQRAFLARSCAFVHFSSTQRASLVGLQEWQARGPAAALAAGLGAPVLDAQAPQILTAGDALAGLPDTALTMPATRSDDVTAALPFGAWVRVHDVGHLDVMAVTTDGMRRFGLPELRMGPLRRICGRNSGRC